MDGLTMIGLNGFRVAVRPDVFNAYVRDLPDSGDLEQVRAAAGDAWALWRSGGTLFGVPNGAVTNLEGATERKLIVGENLGFVAF